MNKVCLTVRIDPYPMPSLFKFCRHLFDKIQPCERFAVTAENNLFKVASVADCRKHFCSGWFMLQLEMMAFYGEIFKLSAEDAAVGAAVGDVQVELISYFIDYRFALVIIAEPEEFFGVTSRDSGNILN